MDTGTVLEIIKMIDNELERVKTSDYIDDGSLFEEGYQTALERFNAHLQGFIEAQVNAMENQGSE
jgi:hypothetical protein